MVTRDDVTCESCGERNPRESASCLFCGALLDRDGREESDPATSRLPPGRVLVGAAAGAVTVAAIGTFAFTRGDGDAGHSIASTVTVETSSSVAETTEGTSGPTPTVARSTRDEEAILAAHAEVCPAVSEHTDCDTLAAIIEDFGDVDWLGQAHAAKNNVAYNTHYTATPDEWRDIVAHAVGGHIDTWNEIVEQVGEKQAWVDYYDIDEFAVPWAESRWSAVADTSRSFSAEDAKEAFLDCAGPVAHDYWANYLSLWGLDDVSAQESFCSGYADILEQALTQTP